MSSTDWDRLRLELEQEIAAKQALLDAYALVAKDAESRGLTLFGNSEVKKEVTPQQAPASIRQGAAVQRVPRASGMSDDVRKSINRLGEIFTLDDIEQDLVLNGAMALERDQISYILSRFVRQKEVVQVERGRGKRAGIFGKPQTGQSAAE